MIEKKKFTFQFGFDNPHYSQISTTLFSTCMYLLIFSKLDNSSETICT